MIDGIRRSVDKRTCTAFVPTPPESVFCTENERCRGCPYPAHGVICWHRDGTCLRTDMEKIERPANKSQVEISGFGSSEKGNTKSSR